jgi:UDP-N-acetylglucosamine 4-epimerase
VSDRYLVTGGGGFIGSHLVRALLERGHSVRVLDNFATGKRENLAGVTGPLEVVEGDIRNGETVRAALREVDHVLHTAALPSVARSVADPQNSHDVNINGTLNLLIAARDAKVKRFVFSSSSSVYGENPELPKHERLPTMPLSPYAVTKLAAEHYCQVFASLYGLQTVSLRYFNVFGPRQDPNSQYSAAIPRFITWTLRGESPQINGDGQQTRDFTYVANVVHANLLACTVPGVGGLVCNIGGGRRVSLLELLAQLAKLSGRKVEPVFGPPRAGDVRDSQADIGRAREKLGYEPLVQLEAGLAQTMDYFKNLV